MPIKSILLSFSLLIAISVHGQYTNKLAQLYPNNLSLRPFNLDNSGIGFGIAYERYLDSGQNFSVHIPVHFGFQTGRYNDNEMGYSFNPGIRIYFTEPRITNWYVGCSIMGSYYSEEGTYFDPITNLIKSYPRSFGVGPQVNVGFKGTIKNKVTYNIEAGSGYRVNSLPIIRSNNSRYMGSLSFGLGYCF